jgi:hypothetical protein
MLFSKFPEMYFNGMLYELPKDYNDRKKYKIFYILNVIKTKMQIKLNNLQVEKCKLH